MKAIVIEKPGQIEIKEIPMPEVKENEALLKVKCVGICGADVASYTGNQPFTTYPRIPGHEFSAEIVEIPENDKATFDMLSHGKTMGVFQMESAGITGVCTGLKPKSIEDITAIIALYRPGPMDSIPKFIENKLNHLQTSLIKEISSVVCDRSGRVWIGTDKQLFAYLKTSESFALFGISDGVMSNEFLGKPKLLSKNGDVYMGGVLGLLRIDSEFVTDNQEEPVIRLDRLKVDGKDVRTGKDGYHRLSRKDRTLYISVAAYERDIFRAESIRNVLKGIEI